MMTGKDLDEGFLITIFDQFAQPLYKYIVRHCREPIAGDNIVGDTFVQLLERSVADEDHRNDLRSYLYQIAYGYIVKYWRDNQLYSEEEPTDISSGEPANTLIQPQADRSTSEDELFSALSERLTKDQLQVLSLYFLEDFSLRDTAKILGKRVNEIRTSLSDIRKTADPIIARDPGLLFVCFKWFLYN